MSLDGIIKFIDFFNTNWYFILYAVILEFSKLHLKIIQIIFSKNSWIQINLGNLIMKVKQHLQLAAASIATLLLSSAARVDAVQIKGDITADNCFALYTGTNTSANSLYTFTSTSGNAQQRSCVWDTPVSFNFSTSDSTIYIAAWSDDAIAQGLLHDLTVDGQSLFSGDPRWEVYATGINLAGGYYSPGDDPAPSLTDLTTQINIANAGTGGANTSHGWVKPFVGQANGSAPWYNLPAVDTNAHWTWYDSGNDTSSGAPLSSSFNHNEYLIFRVSVPEPTTAWGLLLVGGLAWQGTRRRQLKKAPLLFEKDLSVE